MKFFCNGFGLSNDKRPQRYQDDHRHDDQVFFQPGVDILPFVVSRSASHNTCVYLPLRSLNGCNVQKVTSRITLNIAVITQRPIGGYLSGRNNGTAG
jgi:hypothetical protein